MVIFRHNFVPKQSFHLVIHLILDFNIPRVSTANQNTEWACQTGNFQFDSSMFSIAKNIEFIFSNCNVRDALFFSIFALNQQVFLNQLLFHLCVPITGGRAQPEPIRLFCYLGFSNQKGDDVIFHPSLHDSAFVAREQLLLLSSLRISTFWPYNTLFCLESYFSCSPQTQRSIDPSGRLSASRT